MVDEANEITGAHEPESAEEITSAAALVKAIERRIALGELGPGDRLPSVRSVSDQLGIGHNTVASAYRQLRERGAVVGRGRQGTTVADRPLVTPVLSAPVPDGVTDAMTGNPDPALLPAIAAHVADATGDVRRVRYGGAAVHPDLATEAARALAADAVPVQHITVVSGAMDAVERLLTLHTRPGDAVAVEDPGYPAVHQVVTGLGLDVVPVSVDPRGPDPASLAQALQRGVQAVVITPRAQNPTGAALDLQRSAALDEVLAGHPDVLVVLDDHAGPVAGTDFVGLAYDRPRWAVVRSVAKSLGPDLRVALLAGDADTVARVEARLQLGPGWVSHILQRTVAGLLADPAAAESAAAARASYARRRARLATRLEAAGVATWSASGLNVWIPVDSEPTVIAAMRDRGWAIRAGEGFRITSAPAVRITIAGLDERQIDAIADDLLDVVGRSGTTRLA